MAESSPDGEANPSSQPESPQAAAAGSSVPPVFPEPTPSRRPRSTSFRLFVRAREGDSSALNRLFAHLLPSLQRWARHRLPSWARRRVDTGDLVQEAFVNLFRRMGQIEPRRRGALRAYLQESIRNRIRDEVRRAGMVETTQATDPGWRDRGTSPLEHAVSREKSARYRDALARLDLGDQELIVGRIELGYSYEQLAIVSGRVTPDATRVAVRRALVRLAKTMGP